MLRKPHVTYTLNNELYLSYYNILIFFAVLSLIEEIQIKVLLQLNYAIVQVIYSYFLKFQYEVISYTENRVAVKEYNIAITLKFRW